MVNINDLMKNATDEQKTILRKLKDLANCKNKLIEETKKSCDKENQKRYFFPRLEPDDVFRPMTDEQAREYLNSYSSSTKRRLDTIQGEIKKVIQDARSSGVLVVNYNNLK